MEGEALGRVYKVIFDEIVGVDELDRPIGKVNVDEGVFADTVLEARPLIESVDDIGAEGVAVCYNMEMF